MNITIDFLKSELIGADVPIPVSGTLSGHAAGEPFDKHAHLLLDKRFSGRTFRQYEYLNKLYQDNPFAISIDNRWSLIDKDALAFLLNRGRSATANWSKKNLFVEKQNDTADILVISEGFFNFIDIKTFNTRLSGQAPNIISSYKLAKMCKLMLDKKEFSTHSMTYVEIDWEVRKDKLVCTDVSIVELFKCPPKDLYINWAAGYQIQFHVRQMNPSYTGNVEQWCKDYLYHFRESAERRIDADYQKFIKAFKL